MSESAEEVVRAIVEYGRAIDPEDDGIWYDSVECTFCGIRRFTQTGRAELADHHPACIWRRAVELIDPQNA